MGNEHRRGDEFEHGRVVGHVDPQHRTDDDAGGRAQHQAAGERPAQLTLPGVPDQRPGPDSTL